VSDVYIPTKNAEWITAIRRPNGSVELLVIDQATDQTLSDFTLEPDDARRLSALITRKAGAA
jgi:hypothetical protein